MQIPNITNVEPTPYEQMLNLRQVFALLPIPFEERTWEKEVINTLLKEPHRFDIIDKLVRDVHPDKNFDSRKMFLVRAFLNGMGELPATIIVPSGLVLGEYENLKEEGEFNITLDEQENRRINCEIRSESKELTSQISFVLANDNQSKLIYNFVYDTAKFHLADGNRTISFPDADKNVLIPAIYIGYQAIDDEILKEMNKEMGERYVQEFASMLSKLISEFATHDVSIHGMTNHTNAGWTHSTWHFDKYDEESFALFMHKKLMSELSQDSDSEKGIGAMAKLGVDLIEHLESFAEKSFDTKMMVLFLVKDVVCYHLSTIFPREELEEKFFNGTLVRDLPEMARKFRFNEQENYVLDRDGNVVEGYSLEDYLLDLSIAMEKDCQKNLPPEANAKIHEMYDEVIRRTVLSAEADSKKNPEAEAGIISKGMQVGAKD